MIAAKSEQQEKLQVKQLGEKYPFRAAVAPLSLYPWSVCNGVMAKQ